MASDHSPGPACRSIFERSAPDKVSCTKAGVESRKEAVSTAITISQLPIRFDLQLQVETVFPEMVSASEVAVRLGLVHSLIWVVHGWKWRSYADIYRGNSRKAVSN